MIILLNFSIRPNDRGVFNNSMLKNFQMTGATTDLTYVADIIRLKFPKRSM